MTNNSGLGVVRLTRDGRRRFDEGTKRALIEEALRPGVSVARLALEHGVNANLLRKWITKYLMQREAASESGHRSVASVPNHHIVETIDTVPDDTPLNEPAASPQPTFVPVIASAPKPPVVVHEPLPGPAAMAVTLHVRLPNGVELDLREASFEALTTIVQMLGRLPCSGSTKD